MKDELTHKVALTGATQDRSNQIEDGHARGVT